MTDPNLYSSMQVGKPYKSYKKTILAKVFVTYLDPITNTVEGKLLSGDPRDLNQDVFIDMWSEREDLFFKRNNRRQLETGTLIAFDKPIDYQEPVPEPFANASDEELKKILDKPYFSLVQALKKTTSLAVLFRFLSIARESDKSESFIQTIETRISEVQGFSSEES